MSRKLTQEEFISRAKAVHGEGRFDYSLVEYHDMHSYINIKCNVCGTVYRQEASMHVSGVGCPECNRRKRIPTTEEIVRRFKAIHGEGRYNYSRVEYKKRTVPVEIKCNICGNVFMQTPATHLNGSGCPECAARAKFTLTTEEIVRRFREKHGDRYDYSETEFLGQDKKVKIICRKHGPFWMTIYNHLKGQGCPKCKGEKVTATRTMTQEEFLEKARKVHGDKYDYSKVVYAKTNKKITIICPEHGEFHQTPNSHLCGKGCMHCGSKQEEKKPSHEELIRKFKEAHGDKYDYSQVKYVNNVTPVKIICPHHGIFLQAPANHSSGQGCPKCGSERSADSIRLTQDQFISKCREIHDNKYDYSKTIYKNNRSLITIICPRHGEFRQTAHTHISGHGCPICNESVGERRIRKWLSFHGIPFKAQHPMRIHGRILRADFYLKERGLVIEYNGIQHYRSVKRFRGEKGFKDCQRRDRLKFEYCARHGFSVIVIPYTYLKQIDSMLSERLLR